jgi:uncharacterized cupredoxin-like copper-binding protein
MRIDPTEDKGVVPIEMSTAEAERRRQARRDAFSVFSATLAVVAVVFAVVATWASNNAQDNAERSDARAERAAVAASHAPAPGAAAVNAGTGAGGVALVHVNESEFHVTIDRTTAPHGKVMFTSTNIGTVSHELVVMQTDNPPNRLPIDPAQAKAVEDGQGDKDLGEIEDIAPGHTKSNSLTLPAGHYVLLCNLPGHYQQGMWAAFTLT